MEQMIVCAMAMMGAGRPCGLRMAICRNKTVQRSTWRVNAVAKDEEGV
jgi:hypothetical protein